MTSIEQQARDLLDRARQVLEAIPPDEEWIQVGLGNIHANPVGSQPPRAKTWSSRIGDLVAEAPTLIRDLADRLEFMEHEFEVERDGRNEHFDARMDAEAEARDLAAGLSRLRAQETRIRAHIARERDLYAKTVDECIAYRLDYDGPATAKTALDNLLAALDTQKGQG